MTTITLTTLPDQFVGIDSDEFGHMFLVTLRGQAVDADGNVVITGRKHREAIPPDVDIRSRESIVKEAAKLVRTPERLARYEAAKPEEPVAEAPTRER